MYKQVLPCHKTQLNQTINHWWNNTILQNSLYQIRIDESSRITLRDCCFLRKVEFQTMSIPILSALFEPTCSACNVSVTYPNSPISAAVEHPMEDTYRSCPWYSYCMPSRIPLALFRLFPHNIATQNNCLPLVGPCLHVGQEQGRCKNSRFS